MSRKRRRRMRMRKSSSELDKRTVNWTEGNELSKPFQMQKHKSMPADLFKFQSINWVPKIPCFCGTLKDLPLTKQN
jgi:hypothetical protein